MTIDATNDLQSARQWPGMRSEYAWLAPHEGFSVTGAYQIGASFTHHRDLVFHHAGHESVRNVQAGAVFVTGAEGIAWSRVQERTEALEIYPDRQLLEDTAREHGRRELTIEPAAFVNDPVVLSVAATLKRVHITNAYLSDLAASTLAQRLADQIVDVYSGTSRLRAQRNAGRLQHRTLTRVTDYIESHLGTTITLQQLSNLAHSSSFHFARRFKQSTGMAPHQYVTMRRIEHAKCQLLTGRRSIEQIAASVSFTNLSHFRRVFKMYYGKAPSTLRPPLKSRH